MELEHYNGKNYRTVVVKRYIIFPQHAGQLKISQGKYEVSIQVLRPVRSPFGIMNTMQEVSKTITTAPVTIHVSPFPAGKPCFFYECGRFFFDEFVYHSGVIENK